MKYLIAMLMVTLLQSCNAEMKTRKHIESLLNAQTTEKYQAGIACMRYISKPGSDIGYSKKLVSKLLGLGFFAESISAVDILQKRFPQDPELYYLHGLGYHNLLQYDLAVESFDRARRMQPENQMFTGQSLAVLKEKQVWEEIQAMNQSLVNSTDSFAVLLDRADSFFSIRQYDAVLYDLGTLSKMVSTSDSLYYANSVSSLYQGGGRKSIEILTDMMEHYRTIKTSRISPAR
jgi:tetratricopeptide (TPR) repeat protein